MGCTSSAPNMANSSTAEKSIQFEDETSDDQSKDVEEIIYRAANDSNDTNVLPSCDTLPEPVHLVRNKSTASLKQEKENTEDKLITKSMNKVQSSGSLHSEEKVPRLEEIVDKVVGVHMTEHMDNTQPVEKVPEEPPKVEEPTDKQSLKEDNEEEEINKEVTEEQNTEKMENEPEEALSPSQSESSRATRWEALADIAAELPPSLTVDPITGQIYSLSK